ncbi:hypothetical protein ACIBCM_27020 [Streptomyces sp. NPDC051018]|uniref:hypothetical protein n=1 Tax=Streptomyces sp. NPDC051018 TaxID=3365639 RepID=UPI0037BCBF29
MESLSDCLGITDRMVEPWGPDGTDLVAGRWAGIICESVLLPLTHYDALMITFRFETLEAMTDSTSGDALFEDGAIALVHAFRDACTELSPASAFISTHPWALSRLWW